MRKSRCRAGTADRFAARAWWWSLWAARIHDQKDLIGGSDVPLALLFLAGLVQRNLFARRAVIDRLGARAAWRAPRYGWPCRSQRRPHR
jgi:hypothetical protein